MYVPTNHIYFGDIHIYPISAVSYPDLSVQEGVQVFLTGGMARGSARRRHATAHTHPRVLERGGDGERAGGTAGGRRRSSGRSSLPRAVELSEQMRVRQAKAPDVEDEPGG